MKVTPTISYIMHLVISLEQIWAYCCRSSLSLALERQVDGWLHELSLAVGGGAHVGWSVDRPNGVAGAHEEVR